MSKTSLSEKDYVSIIDLHKHFVGCNNWTALNDCLRLYFLPLLDCDSLAFGWRDLDLAAKQVRRLNITGFVGLTRRDAEFLEQITPYCTTMNKKLLDGSRSVIACDVDVPRKTVSREVARFQSDHPEYQHPQNGIGLVNEKKMTTYMALIDRFETGLGMGVHRMFPNDKRFTLRDVRVMELVRPILFQTIRVITLSEELAKYRSLSEPLADIPTGVALVRKDMRVFFINTAFHNLIPLEPGYKLPPDLAMAVQKEVDKHSQKPLEPFTETPFYKLRTETFRLSVDRVLKGNEGEEYWILRLKPADDAFSQMNLKMQERGLGNREKEICCLIKDGFSDADMAARLFISLHTVRTHLKNIHQKLDVRSRARLVALLNRQEETADGRG